MAMPMTVVAVPVGLAGDSCLFRKVLFGISRELLAASGRTEV